MTRRYLIVIEETPTGFSAYSPDLPGCIATGTSASEVKRAMREAIELHVAGLREEGQPVPEPQSSSDYVEVSA